MGFGHTEQKLEAITDAGRFEKIATAILREADPSYRSLIHPGVNAQGKTVKAPVDGIGFVAGAVPPHMIIVQHTTTESSGLADKWLHDPTTVKPRGSKPTAPPGDVRKAMAIATEQRVTLSDLVVTLILTASHEPDEKTVRDVQVLAEAVHITVDFWTRSRLAHFLDNNPEGQWLRRQFFGEEPERLSGSLLRHLACKSLDAIPLYEEPRQWISRGLDQELSRITRLGSNFLVAASGFGKSIACYKMLHSHVDSGGMGLLLSHELIIKVQTLDGAVESALRELHPSLGPGVGTEAISLCTPDKPLLLIVEDINRAGDAAHLAEKIVGWDRQSHGEDTRSQRPYRVICPIWPEALGALRDGPRRAIDERTLVGESFTPEEARTAIHLRAQEANVSVSDMAADESAAALGFDPLMIGLYDPAQKHDSTTVIADFIERRIVRLAITRGDHPAARYRGALRAYAAAALCRRQLEPRWSELESWNELTEINRALLGNIVQSGSIISLRGGAANQRISYRHDRVRDWLLADAATELAHTGDLQGDILGDPYFAGVFAGALAIDIRTDVFLERVAQANPLALFLSLKRLPSTSVAYRQVLHAIDVWMNKSDLMSPAQMRLRWEAVTALADTEAPDVIRLVARMQDRSWAGMRARLRNGDLTGGAELCLRVEPGSTAPWRDIQLDHAKRRFGAILIQTLDEVLRRTNLTLEARVGFLRFAGHMADARLAPAIEACWGQDAARNTHLDDYLWAFAECCSDDPGRFLGPVCDAWAQLPAERENDMPSPRDDLAANHVRWAFRHWVPRAAIPYFIERARNDDLRWPIVYMLSEIDDAGSIKFVVEQIANAERRATEADSYFPFASMLPRNWERLQENGQPMSPETRTVLQALFLEPDGDKHIRRQAFRLWSATHQNTDLELLRRSDLPEDLKDEALRQRLMRRDKTAVPALLQKLTPSENHRHEWWWSFLKYVWSDDLLPVLDSELSRRAANTEATWQLGKETDYDTSDLLMRLPQGDAEALLIKHWPSLRYVGCFVQAALYVATPRLQSLVGVAMTECSEPHTLLQHVGTRMGLKMKGHPGIMRPSQVEALARYLSHLEKYEVQELWEICNEHGWFEVRHSALDPHLRQSGGVPFEDEAQVYAQLDDMAAPKQMHSLSYWLDRYAKTGATDEQRLARIRVWLETRKTMAAMKIASEALIQIGRRSDLTMLDTPLTDADGRLEALKANTVFAVQRRSLA